MTSRRKETVHKALLEKLMSDSGLECLQSPVVSLLTSEEEEETEEEEGEAEEAEPEAETTIEEEPEPIMAEEMGEELSQIFPTPSLRRMISEKMRKIEALNRIHVLPNDMEIDFEEDSIPRFNTTAPQPYMDAVAALMGCTRYKNSLAEYWAVDTAGNLLRRAQEDGLSKVTQKAVVQWFCEWIKEMQHFDTADRDRMIRRWRDVMLTAARFIAEEKFLPFPSECEVYYKVREEESPMSKRLETHQRVGKMEEVVDEYGNAAMKLVWKASSHGLEGHDFDCSLRDISKISHYIYDLFSTDFQFDLIRSVFCHTPEYNLVEPPFQLQIPKRMYTVLKPGKGKPKSPTKKDNKAQAKKGAKGGKASAEPDTEEYIKLMAMIDKERERQDEQDERDREDWNKRSTILPLSFAATDELFEMYWPTPPPPPVISPIVAPPEVKDKKGKKKK